MIQREPQKFFAVLWLIWSAQLVMATIHPSKFGLLLLWGSFFLIEGTAQVMKNGGRRDTLSELSTLIHRRLSKHRDAWSGWNALLFTPYFMLIGLALYRTIALAGDPAAHIAGAVIAGFMVRGLYGHIVNTELHG